MLVDFGINGWILRGNQGKVKLVAQWPFKINSYRTAWVFRPKRFKISPFPLPPSVSNPLKARSSLSPYLMCLCSALLLLSAPSPRLSVRAIWLFCGKPEGITEQSQTIKIYNFNQNIYILWLTLKQSCLQRDLPRTPRCCVDVNVNATHLALQCFQVQTLLLQFALLLPDFLHQLINSSVLSRQQPLETAGGGDMSFTTSLCLYTYVSNVACASQEGCRQVSFTKCWLTVCIFSSQSSSFHSPG